MHAPNINPLNTELGKCYQAIVNSSDPASDLKALRQSGELIKVVPEYEACWGPYGEQDERWHPEGNTWIHTLMVLNNLRDCKEIAIRFAGAFHDIAKPLTFHRFQDGAIANHGHEYAGAYLFSEGANPIGKRFGLNREIITEVEWLIRHHMFMQVLGDEKRVGPGTIKKILFHPLTEKLLILHNADANGTAASPDVRRNNVALARKLIEQGAA